MTPRAPESALHVKERGTGRAAQLSAAVVCTIDENDASAQRCTVYIAIGVRPPVLCTVPVVDVFKPVGRELTVPFTFVESVLKPVSVITAPP